MPLRLLRLPALVLALAMLDAAFDAPRPAEAAGTCSPADCLSNSAVNNRVQPTTVGNDDKGDVTFFASQSGQLANVVLVLDNSTSMYELPYDNASFPNSSWVNVGLPATPTNGRTPNGCNFMGNAGTDPACGGTQFSSTAASCANNNFLKNLTDATGALYNKSTTYAFPDPFFDGTHGTGKFFQSTDVYSFFEWAQPANVAVSVPGGTTNVGFGITFVAGTGVGGTVNPYCADSALSNAPGSGGRGGSGPGAWSMTQQQRCQQCVDAVGYYIAPAATVNDNDNGHILFTGNFLNFYPPKFLVARRALTDFISNQTKTSTPVRLGVVSYDPANVGSADVPGTGVGFVGRHDGGAFVSNGMIPDCDVATWTGSATIDQKDALIRAVRGISFGDAANPIATPLAETVFNVGQFLSGDNKLYQTAFTGGSSDIWLKPGFTAPTGANKPLCVACQLSAIVLITDGAPFGDNNLPQKFRDNTIQCSRTPTTNPDPCGLDQNNGTPNLLDDVTNFLATTDLSPDASGGLKGTQNAITYVIGMGLSVPLLDNAARYGKTNAATRVNNGKQLQDQLASAVVSIASRSTAFSSSAVQTLEVGSGSTAFVPRFTPGFPTDPVWEGHLFRFDLYNEFVTGTDLNGDGKLDGVFLVDKAVDIVSEDDKGAFVKVKNGQPAVPVWDAGAQLAAMPAANRKIYTAVWDATNSAWRTLLLPTWGGSGTPPADFTTVGNALGIDGTTACATIQGAMATPIPAAYLSSAGTFDRDHCIKAIVDYVRGLNIRNEVTGDPSVTINRPRVLGDIFHSSPVLVDPPVDQFFCDLGLHPQCVSTLYQYDSTRLVPRLATPTPSDEYTVTDGKITAYEKYWRDHESRKRVVLVGANDGMIHAFDAGSPTSSPPSLNTSVGFRSVVYGTGTGDEVWAFIPPDQLPRLWLMLRGHQVYVDGDIMVRDIWVDGVQNDKAAGGFVNKQLVKQDVEYHTVAVAGERQGGNHFFALDVTDTNTPKMLWVYPPPCSDEEALWGQSWAQFSPRPPPIGPLLLQTSNTAGPANYNVDHTEERYAVFLNGGHSPYMNRGRIASILDAWTGAPLFSASYNPSAASTDPAKAMRFGFPAAGALVDYGTENQYQPDGFFDTAVIGDEGGQLWNFRMSKPGHINTSTGLIDNWTFGRAYEPNVDAPDDPRYRQPIYTVASTTVQDDTGWLRAYIGTGDRAHVRSQSGGDCRPDDPMTCITAGCAVSTSLQMDNATRRYASTFASASGSSASTPAFSSPAQSFADLSGSACNAAAVTETVQVSSCPVSTMNFTENTLSFSCSGSPLTCAEGAFPLPTPNKPRNDATTPPVGPNTFVGVAVLANGALSRTLNAPADASAYDQGRFKLASLVDVTNTTANASGVTSTSTAPAASRTSPGWVVHYGTLDEKTVTSAAILGGCVLWNSLLPTGGAAGCASSGTNVAVTYQGDPFSGAPTCASSFNFARSINYNVLYPPAEPGPHVAMGAGGSSMRLSVLEVQPGAQQVSQTIIGTDSELLQMIQSLPLTYDQHLCRHVDKTACK
jgi:type IV pilus assembly protein PilY1